MQKIRLYTRDGIHLVTVVSIPRMTPYPEIIVWGSRFFSQQADGKYCEALAYAVPETSSLEVLKSTNANHDDYPS